MNTGDVIKEMVKEKYNEIATQPKQQNVSSCCGSTACCGDELYNIMSEDYSKLEGYTPDADLGLGCGVPTEFANIKEGDTVVDLGSGAGNDAFVVRKIVGDKGKVIGVDFTDKMIELSRNNAVKLSFTNVEFRSGDIESLPIFSNKADVIISNCVLNLVPNKHRVFSEIYRVLKPGGHFSISDIVLEGTLPPNGRQLQNCMPAACQEQFKNQSTWQSLRRVALKIYPCKKKKLSIFRKRSF